MSEVTRILADIEAGDPRASERLLPLVYDELRRLATMRMAQEKTGHTLQATALVHEAFLRLVEDGRTTAWDSRGHFFAAAGEAMRRILVERARAKQRIRRGGNWKRVEFRDLPEADESQPELVLAISEALEHLAEEDQQLAELVKLRCFVGFSLPEAAGVLGLAVSTAYVRWEYAKSRLRCLLDGQES